MLRFICARGMLPVNLYFPQNAVCSKQRMCFCALHLFGHELLFVSMADCMNVHRDGYSVSRQFNDRED